MEIIFHATEWIFLTYFVGLNTGYITLNLIAVANIRQYMEENAISILPNGASDIMPPVSLIVPAYNEASTIIGSVRALMQLDYPEFEVIVINDGSSDDTLAVLEQAFNLHEFPEAFRVRIGTQPVNKVYRSAEHAKLRVIDKANGGKADSINTGINASRYPLFCAVDADSILQQDSLKKAVQPFILDSTTVATGGTIRIVNGCETRFGFMTGPRLPKNMLALFQIVEYLRAFLFGRLGWSPFNALLIISGAFGVFHKETVVAAGGYRHDTVGEDMELVVRLHRIMRARKKPYRITYIPDPICWTEAPEDFRTLARQRIRWQRGLAQSLFMNISLLFNPRAGSVGLISFPFFLVFEWLGPIIEILGFVLVTTGFVLGYISLDVFVVLLAAAFGLGILLSFTALLLEETSFHIYHRPRDLMVLSVVVLLENLGFRQLNSVWRIIGMVQWLYGVEQKWGDMKRTGQWH
ncbi:MAG: glycosyltransferase [Gammaproteobacteria bacterium]|jgi:cellulose synthase/poly-beta-1,6-N-acetylglucosamine synthase-like glycosyltransferase